MAQLLEPQFKKEDVWALARAVLDYPVFETPSGRMVCRYCDVKAHWQDEPFPHAKDCLTFIAQDILTGAA
jgi:hypothetical protein